MREGLWHTSTTTTTWSFMAMAVKFAAQGSEILLLRESLGRTGPKNGGGDVPKAMLSLGGGEICSIHEGMILSR